LTQRGMWLLTGDSQRPNELVRPSNFGRCASTG
jgi:hypothetical protein